MNNSDRDIIVSAIQELDMKLDMNLECQVNKTLGNGMIIELILSEWVTRCIIIRLWRCPGTIYSTECVSEDNVISTIERMASNDYTQHTS